MKENSTSCCCGVSSDHRPVISLRCPHYLTKRGGRGGGGIETRKKEELADRLPKDCGYLEYKFCTETGPRKTARFGAGQRERAPEKAPG